MEPIKTVPDGGWGWVIVAGVALINTTNQSLLSLFGLIFGQKLMMTHGATGVTLVMSINCMVTNFSGLFTGPVLKTFTPRVVATFGVVCTSFGMLISSQATTIYPIIVGYGVLTGLGLGLIASSTFIVVNSYFKERKSQAVGLSMAGTSIGQMAMPKVVGFLLDEFGFPGTTLILGAICLHGIVGAMLFHPVNWHMKVIRETQSLLHNDDKKPAIIKIEEPEHKIQTINLKKSKSKRNICFQILEKLDLELLLDLTFLHIITGLAIIYSCSVAFSTFLPLFLQKDLELNTADTTLCMSLLSLADIFGRLIVPLIAKFFGLSNRMTFLVGAIALALARSFFVEQTDYTMLICTSILIGLVRAATVINQNLTVAEYTPDAKLPAALGWNMVAKGIFVMALGQLLGIMEDYFDSFRLCIHLVDMIVLGVIACWSLELVFKKLRPS